MGQDKNHREPDAPAWTQVQQRAHVRILIWIVAVLYLLYLGYQLIKGYLRGASGLSLGVLVAVLIVFAVAIVGILLLAVRQWKRNEQRVARMIQEEKQREEDELKRRIRLDALNGGASAASEDGGGTDEEDGENG